MSDRKNFYIGQAVHPFQVQKTVINPTEKDLQFYLHLLNGWSLHSHYVLELGSGSGSFMIASMLTNRTLYSFERDVKQCKAISVRIDSLVSRLTRTPVEVLSNFLVSDVEIRKNAWKQMQELPLNSSPLLHQYVRHNKAAPECLVCSKNDPVHTKICPVCGLPYHDECYGESENCNLCSS